MTRKTTRPASATGRINHSPDRPTRSTRYSRKQRLLPSRSGQFELCLRKQKSKHSRKGGTNFSAIGNRHDRQAAVTLRIAGATFIKTIRLPKCSRSYHLTSYASWRLTLRPTN